MLHLCRWRSSVSKPTCAGVDVDVGMCGDLCVALDVGVLVGVADVGLMMEGSMSVGVVVVVVVDVCVDVEMDVCMNLWIGIGIDVSVDVGVVEERVVAVDMAPPVAFGAALIMGLWKRSLGLFVGLDVSLDVEVDVGLGVDVDMAVCVALDMNVWISVGLDEDTAVVAREPREPLLKNPSLAPK